QAAQRGVARADGFTCSVKVQPVDGRTRVHLEAAATLFVHGAVLRFLTRLGPTTGREGQRPPEAADGALRGRGGRARLPALRPVRVEDLAREADGARVGGFHACADADGNVDVELVQGAERHGRADAAVDQAPAINHSWCEHAGDGRAGA